MLRKIFLIFSVFGMLCFTLSGFEASSAKNLGITSIKTQFGFVKINNVVRPKKNKCVSAGVVADIRNMNKLNMFGISIDLRDDFDNVVAHAVIETSDDDGNMKPRGIYRTKMLVCAKNHNWDGPYYFEDPIQGISSTNKYTIFIYDFVWDGIYGKSSYILRK